jgi:hypothetical protein
MHTHQVFYISCDYLAKVLQYNRPITLGKSRFYRLHMLLRSAKNIRKAGSDTVSQKPQISVPNSFEKEEILKKALTLLAVGILCGIFFISTNVFALSIMLDDGLGNVVTRTDGVGADPVADGVITFNGSLGVGSPWMVNVITGISKPLLGSASNPSMHLNSVNVSTIGAGSLKIWMTDTDFGPNPSITGFNYGFGGITNGTVQLDVYADAANNKFGTGTDLGSLGPFSGGAFSGTGMGLFNDTDEYSLSMLVSISHGDGIKISSFDAEINPVPEPATMFLLGGGLIGLAGFGRKKLLKK